MTAEKKIKILNDMSWMKSKDQKSWHEIHQGSKSAKKIFRDQKQNSKKL
jgi:hypothetical protein